MTEAAFTTPADAVDQAASAAADQAFLNEIAAMCVKRSGTYSMLSRLFASEPDAALVEDLHGGRFPSSTGCPDADQGYRMIATYLSGRWAGTVADLAVDFSRTFVGNSADAFSAAYPMESVYTSEKRLRMQEARDEVLAIYRSHKLDKADAWAESEDHLSAELEFMQVLCDRAAACLTSGDEDGAIAYLTTQRNFLEDHLVCWVPMLCQDMKRFAKTDFYRGLAFLTDGFLQTDFEFLSDLLSEDSDDEASAADAAPGANAAADDSTAVER